MNTKLNLATILILAGIGFIGYKLVQQEKLPPNPGNQNAVPPPPPPSQANELRQWVELVVSIFGNVKELWEPGGLFYNNRDEVEQYITPPPGVDSPLV
jgi:hypothetical protein